MGSSERLYTLTIDAANCVRIMGADERDIAIASVAELYSACPGSVRVLRFGMFWGRIQLIGHCKLKLAWATNVLLQWGW